MSTKVVEYGWNDLILPAGSTLLHGDDDNKSLCDEGSDDEHRVSLENIEPDTVYQATVKARNKFGDSQVSDTFKFRTPQKGESRPMVG